MTKDLRADPDAFDESEELLDEDRVTLVDEDNVEHHFVMLALVEYEDEEYALLTPEEGIEEEEGEIELFIFRYEVDETGHEHFVPIDDDERFAQVRDFCATLIDSGDADPVTGEVPEA